MNHSTPQHTPLYIIGTLLILITNTAQELLPQKKIMMMVTVPVADCISEPWYKAKRSLYPTLNMLYNTLPWSNAAQKIVRVHQLLLHETVQLIKEVGKECLVLIPNASILMNGKPTPAIFWTRTEYLKHHKELFKQGISPNQLPLAHNKHSVTLKYPYHDPVTNRTFSAGTRFVQVPAQSDAVYAFDPTTNTMSNITIPAAYLQTALGTNQEKIDAFVQLLKEWAQPTQQGYIPYVWGGCSEIMRTTEPFSTSIIDGQTLYERPNISQTPCTGFDCTGIILRAAQCAGLPYVCKNSTTIVNMLKPLAANERPRNGDIIWIPGHVMVISDYEHNLLLEAAGYDSGHGRVHEIPLAKEFEGIAAYSDLLKHYINELPLKRLNAQQEVFCTIPTFKILRISSVFAS